MGNGFDMISMLPFVLIFGVFYFLILRPQQQKMKKHQAVLANLRRGDQVVTSGGLIGTVSRIVNENEVQLELAENVRVRLVRSTVTEVVTRSGEDTSSRTANQSGVRAASSDSLLEGEAKPFSGKAKKPAVPRVKKDRKTPATRSAGKTKT